MRPIVVFLVLVFSAQSCLAWSEGGHHLIAVLAYYGALRDGKLMAEVYTLVDVQTTNTDAFKLPDYPENLPFNPEFWMVGRAGYWPDIVRRTEHDRPNLHWQLGATFVVGNPVDVPNDPGPLPAGATLQTKDLHLAQAVELCRQILRNKSKPAIDRAVALCWLMHLVADAHQPCQCGSLYTEKLFPKGDRGGNEIPTKQRQNLHALWDSLLGPKWDQGDVERRSTEIKADATTWEPAMEAAKAPDGLNPMTWISEGRQLAKEFVYAPEVVDEVKAAEASGAKLEPIDLSEAYLKSAGKLARERAAVAAWRLAEILRQDLKR